MIFIIYIVVLMIYGILAKKHYNTKKVMAIWIAQWSLLVFYSIYLIYLKLKNSQLYWLNSSSYQTNCFTKYTISSRNKRVVKPNLKINYNMKLMISVIFLIGYVILTKQYYKGKKYPLIILWILVSIGILFLIIDIYFTDSRIDKTNLVNI